MQEAPFKVGDKVICIDPYNRFYKLGMVYTVERLYCPDNDKRWIVQVEGIITGCFHNRFVLNKSGSFSTLYNKLL